MNFVKKWGLWILLFFALLLAFTPMMSRNALDYPLIPGGESYFHIRISHALEESPLMKVDLLQGRSYAFNLYHYLLLILMKLGVSDQVLIISSVFMSLLTAYFFHESLRNINFSTEKSFITVLIYLFSPLYILTSSTTTPYTLAALFLSLSFFLYTSGNETYKYLSMIFAGFLILIEPVALLAYIFVMVVYAYTYEKKYLDTMMFFLAAIVIGFIFKLLLEAFPLIKFSGGLALRNYITDFGAVVGYPFFTLLLALVAISLFWKKHKVHSLAILLLGAFSTIAPGAIILLNGLICVCAALALEFFMRRKWTLGVLRDLTLLLIISSVLFSAVSFTTRLNLMEPTPESIVAFEDVKKSNWNGFVLSKEDIGFLIEYYTLRPAFLDGHYEFYSDYEKKRAAAEIMFESKSPKRVKALMSQHKITFIYTTPDMEQDYNYKGILVVTEVSENFIKIAEFEDRKAWLYIKTKGD